MYGALLAMLLSAATPVAGDPAAAAVASPSPSPAPSPSPSPAEAEVPTPSPSPSPAPGAPATPSPSPSPSSAPASVSGAVVEAPTPDLDALRIHGFVSGGYLHSTHRVNYLAEDSSHGSFEFSEAGINVTKPFGDELRIGLQLFARKLGSTGNFDAKVDWFYLDYRWRSWLGVRAGRVKLPFGLYNDSSDVDAARVPILLPQPIYPSANRDFLLAQSGGEVYGYVEGGPLGALAYNAYYGTIFLQVSETSGSPYEVRRLTVPYVAGGRVFWETPVTGLRVGGSVQQLRLDTDLAVTAPAPAELEVRIPALLWVASAEWTAGDLSLAAEYSRWHVRAESSDPALFPESDVRSERAYVMASWRMRPWLQPGVYVSSYVRDVDERDGRENRQRDAAATLRFDLTPNWLLKLEGHWIDGTADVPTSLNDRPRDELPERWGLFLVKTTAYF